MTLNPPRGDAKQASARTFGLGSLLGPLQHLGSGWGGHNVLWRLTTRNGCASWATCRCGSQTGAGTSAWTTCHWSGACSDPPSGTSSRGALVFPDAEPVLRFYATNRIAGIEDRPADNRHRAELLPLVRARIDAIVQREGAFRVPKSVGWFVADV